MYVQTKAWIAGIDPYSEASRLAVWPKEQGEEEKRK